MFSGGNKQNTRTHTSSSHHVMYGDGQHVHIHAVHEVFSEYFECSESDLRELTFQSDESHTHKLWRFLVLMTQRETPISHTHTSLPKHSMKYLFVYCVYNGVRSDV